jgi:hypothetical protein
MDKVFLLWFTHTFADDREDELLIGVYSSEEAAKAAQLRIGQEKGFVDQPEGFLISPYVLDQDHWASGYILD